MLTSVPLAHIPPGLNVYVALYKDLRNSKQLRDQLLAGNPTLEYAFVDARMVLSSAHLLAAVFRACNDSTQGRLKTRNIHSEIVFALNPNNNIAESFRKFGISETTEQLLVVKVCSESRETVAEQLQGAVDATPVDFDDESLAAFSDTNAIKKVYKLNEPSSRGKQNRSNGEQLGRDIATTRAELEMTILGLLALRGAT